MKKINFLVFVLSILGLATVVFNNSVDLIEKLFNPILNTQYLIGFLLGIFACTWYVIYNWNR